MITGKSRTFLVGIPIAAIVGFFAIARLFPVLGGSDQTVALRIIVQIVAAIGLLVLLTRTLHVSPAPIGLKPFRFSVVGWAVLCVIVSAALSAITAFIVLKLGYAQDHTVLLSLAARPIWLLLLMAAGAGIAEEIVFRSVLLSHVEAATNSTYVGAAVSLVLFALGHTFGWGFSKAVLTLVPGLALTLFFVWKRNLLICILAHFLIDAIGLLTAATLLRHH